MSKQFEASYFILNVRKESEKSKGLNDLCQKLSSAILGDEHLNHGFTFRRKSFFNRKKVFIVFDDVTKLEQIKCLMRVFGNFNSDSRIIITTRDKHVLRNYEVDHIHEMIGLSSHNALQLFALHAFKGNPPTEDYNELSSIVVAYTKGVPLALKVLGSFLFKRTKREWESALKNLRTSLHVDVHKVLKISYDRLNDKEKVVFLDIACFFKGYKRDLIEAILNARDFDSHISIHLLIERCPITTSFDTIIMHDLLEKMGKEIVRQESIDDLDKHGRLWDPDAIFLVLKYNMGTRTIRSICLDMFEVEELHLNPKAFNNMQNLRFLKIYEFEHGKKVHGFEKLESDFSELRYFRWHGYSDKSLPPNFNPKNLVALSLRNSELKQLWTSNQKLVNLKHIDVGHSKRLCSIPDLSLMSNLESLKLEYYINLLESFSSIRNLHKLVILNLQGCKSFDNLQISSNCQSLRVVNLSNCSNLKEVSYFPNTVEELYLDGTTIKEFPSIGHLFRLVTLSLRKCSRLERLLDSIHKLKCLKSFYLSGCSKLDGLPNDMRNLQTLRELELDEISFAEIPTFMTSLINLWALSLTRCKMQKQSNFPLFDLSVFERTIRLNLVDCCIEVLPSNIGQLLSLKYLILGQNNLETLPESIKDLSNLKFLYLSNCQRLKYLPELPSRLETMMAMNCVYLESISSLPASFLGISTCNADVWFHNCFKLKLDMTDALVNIERNADVWHHHEDIIWAEQVGNIVYPRGGIPKWFDLKSNESFIKFSEGWVNDNLTGFVLYVVVSLQDYQQNVGFNLIVNGEMIFSSYLVHSFHFWLKFLEEEDIIESDHVLIGYQYLQMFEQFPTLNLDSQGGVEFFVEHATKNGEVQSQVKKCGVTLLYAKNDDLRRDVKVDKNDERSHKRLKLEG
ncbi:disease resistance-like protein DSC1 [Mangifera indica]|uniref:disease resistance-like protein DSC1 n=1 Tax=Mangifera indica TaxID=29780 RepID=UPI001CFBC25F|nr:disease resistance-like protein DSC1 [Mangifera indica]